jgi:hypothetical protein
MNFFMQIFIYKFFYRRAHAFLFNRRRRTRPYGPIGIARRRKNVLWAHSNPYIRRLLIFSEENQSMRYIQWAHPHFYKQAQKKFYINIFMRANSYL